MKKTGYVIFLILVICFLDFGSALADPDNGAGENEILFAYKVIMHPQHKIKKSYRYFIANIYKEYRINNLNPSSLEQAFDYKSEAVHDDISTLIKRALADQHYMVYNDIDKYKAGDFMLTLHATAGGDESISLVFSVIYPHTAQAQRDCREGPAVELANGMWVYKHCTFTLGESPNRVMHTMLARDWVHPVSKMVFAADESISLYENGNMESGYLVRDWEYPDVGMVFKKSTPVRFYRNGNLYIFTLPKNWKDKTTGNVLKGGTDVYLYDDGRFHICTYDNDITLTNGMIMMRGKKVYYFEDGTVYSATFARTWTDPKTGKVYEAGKKHIFDNK
jgi:hypothetical protein